MEVTATSEGSPIDLTGLSGSDIEFRAGVNYDTAAFASEDIAGGNITITDAANGVFRLLVPETETVNWPVGNAVFQFDINATIGGVAQKIAAPRGTLVVHPNVEAAS